MNLREKQLAAEAETFENSFTRRLELQQKAAKAGQETHAERVAGDKIQNELTEHLRNAFEQAKGRTKGALYAKTKDVPHDVMARIALRCFVGAVVSGMLSTAPGCTVSTFLSKGISRFLKTAVLFLEAEQAGVLQACAQRTKEQTRLLKVLRDRLADTDWTLQERINAATPLWNALHDCGLVKVLKLAEGKRDKWCAVITEKTVELMASSNEAMANLRPIQPLPLVCPPDPWRGLKGGGYLSRTHKIHDPLIRTKNRSIIGPSHKAAHANGDLKRTYSILNQIQNVPLAINEDALWLRKHVRDNGIYISGSTPLLSPPAIDEYPENFEDLPPAEKRLIFTTIKRQKQMASEVPTLLRKWDTTTEIAEKFAGEPFYLAYFLDFRSRVYPMGALTHHSDEATHALFQFHEGVPLGEHGLKWLMVQVANTGDFDKVSKAPQAARIQWVVDNLEAIFDMVEAPEDCDMWKHADCPFGFYAACCDLVRALNCPNPAEYISRIPVALDGSNSGVQHYSAALRAPEGAYVCLTDADPQDLYAKIAERTLEMAQEASKGVTGDRAEWLRQVASISAEIASVWEAAGERCKIDDEPVKLTDEEKSLVRSLKDLRKQYLAAIWCDEGITRSTVKRSVMTFAYSSNAYGFGQQIRDDYMAPLERKVLTKELEAHPFGTDKGSAAATFLGSLIYKATEATLPNVAAGMAWLQKVASILASEGKGVTMRNPLGFPVHIFNTLPDPENRVRLWCSLAGIGKQMSCPVEPKELDKSAQRSSTPPNIIHACDAAHLLLTAERHLKDHSSLLLIHDSFAAHAGSCQALSWTLRDSLASLYENWSPFQQVYDEALMALEDEKNRDKLPPPPEMGMLDLGEVRHALYAFM